jgi:CheY-like chemotaxis protein
MTEITHPLAILVVDDSEDTAQSTAELLLLCGHTVRAVRCGSDALREAAAMMPDVVLLDLGLPGMDGWEVARRMLAQANGKRPVVIVVSGFGSESDRQRSADTGIDLHLIKPVEPAILMDLLSRIRETQDVARAVEPLSGGCT